MIIEQKGLLPQMVCSSPFKSRRVTGGFLVFLFHRHDPALGIGDLAPLHTGHGVVQLLGDRADLAVADEGVLALPDQLLDRGNDSGSAGAGKAYPVANPDTKVLSVAVRDGICYVNLDSSFVNQIYNVTPEVTIYAITNSLVELSNVNKVQISINGETNINYRENISLSATFERNLDLVE